MRTTTLAILGVAVVGACAGLAGHGAYGVAGGPDGATLFPMDSIFYHATAAVSWWLPEHAYAETATPYLIPVSGISDDASLGLDGARSIAVLERDGRTYAVVASSGDNAVQILDITDPHDIVAAGSISANRGGGIPWLYGAWYIVTYEKGDRTYAVVASVRDDAVQILDVTDPHRIVPAGSIVDNRNLVLDGVNSIAIFERDGRTYAAAAAFDDGGVQILDVTDPHRIVPAGSIAANIVGPRDIFILGDRERAYAAVQTMSSSNHLTMIDITDLNDITWAGTIDGNNIPGLDSSQRAVMFPYGDRVYVAVASNADHVKILDWTDPSNVTVVDRLNDNDGNLELDGANDIALFETGGYIYAAVASSKDNGVQILQLAESTGGADGPLTANTGADQAGAPEGGGCLVATAAFGTEMAPQVQRLREVRDETVMSTGTGAAFMSGFNTLYYLVSPQIADIERENPAFREMVKVAIYPMLASLSVMALAESGSEVSVLGVGLLVVAINVMTYLVAPALMGFKAYGMVGRMIRQRRERVQ